MEWSDLSVLIPVVIGALLTLPLEKVRNSYATKREEREESRRVLAESREEQRRLIQQRRERERDAAERIDKEFSALSRQVPELIHGGMDEDQHSAASTAVYAAHDEIKAQAAYLPQNLRQRIILLDNLITWADDIGETKWNPGVHYHSAIRVAQEAATEAHEVIASFLRNQDLAPQPALMLEYETALDEIYAERESEYAEEIDESVSKRERWLAARPELRRQLERRGQQ